MTTGPAVEYGIQRSLRSPAILVAMTLIFVLSLESLSAIAAESSVESEVLRQAMPLYRTVPAAQLAKLTPAAETHSPSNATWDRSSADAANSRYSLLSQINRSNVSKLELAWVYHSADGVGNIQATPVIAGNMLFAPTAGKRIVAINAATGHEVWGTRLPEWASSGRGPATRGLVYWAGDKAHAPRLFFSVSGYLVALDAKTGQLVDSFADHGRASPSKGKGISGFIGAVAPAIYRDIIIAPNENIVDAFDVVTGKRRWRFNTLEYPVEDPEADNGGNVWGGIAMDVDRGIVFVAAGDPHRGQYVGVARPGDDKHTNSVIALDAETGRLLWSFQDVAHNVWDIDTPAPPNLVTIRREGRLFDAVAQVTKQGNTLLLDRMTGRPIFPFRMKRAPVSKLAGEFTSPYQPALERPEPFARQVFSLDDVTDVTPAAHAYVMDKIKGASFGWFAPPEMDRPTIIYPGTWGGAEWTGAAFDPLRQVLYVSSNELPTVVTVSKVHAFPNFHGSSPGAIAYQQHCQLCHGDSGQGKGIAPSLIALSLNRHLKEGDVREILTRGRGAMPNLMLAKQEIDDLVSLLLSTDLTAENSHGNPAEEMFSVTQFEKLRDDRGYPGVRPPWGTLNAIDLNTGKLLWKVPLGEYETLTKQGIPKTGTSNYGGAMVTAGGLVFCAGTLDHKIRAFDHENGKELWSFKLSYGGYAPPATYEIDGRQFIVVADTGGGMLSLFEPGSRLGDSYVAFALGNQ